MHCIPQNKSFGFDRTKMPSPPFPQNIHFPSQAAANLSSYSLRSEELNRHLNSHPPPISQRLPPLSRIPRTNRSENILLHSQNICEFCTNVGHHISSCTDERIIFILNNVKERVRMIIRPSSPNNLQENESRSRWSSYSFNANNLYLYFYNMPICNLKLLADRNGISLNQTASNLSLSLSNKMINDIFLEERMEQSIINFPSQNTENLSRQSLRSDETTNIHHIPQLSPRRNVMSLLQQIENDFADEEDYEDYDDEYDDEYHDEYEEEENEEVETIFPILSRFRHRHLEEPIYINPILLIDIFYYPLQNNEREAIHFPSQATENESSLSKTINLNSVQNTVSPEYNEGEVSVACERKLQDCPICLENKYLDNFITTNCNHNFCEECIETLLKSKTIKLLRDPQRGILVAKIKCPMCRTHVNAFIVREKHLLHKFRSLKDNSKSI